MHETAETPRRAWLWVFAAYLFQSIPAAVRDEALPVALKDLGYADAQITQFVAVFGIIVACKILLSPLVGGVSPRRFILFSQFGIAALLMTLAWLLGGGQAAVTAVFACLTLLSLVSAAHDFA